MGYKSAKLPDFTSPWPVIQATEAKTDRFVKTTKKCLDAEYKQNRKQPICYFRFVIDPDRCSTQYRIGSYP